MLSSGINICYHPVGMHDLLRTLAADVLLCGDIAHDVPAFLAHHGCPRTATHSARVAVAAGHIACQADVDASRAALAGWLHDVSAVFKNEERVTVARALGIPVLPQEDLFPLIIHQKLSAALAREIFGIEDDGVLRAVECHTTLRAGATALGKTLFVADKIEWDQPGEPSYRGDLVATLNRSLDAATTHHLRYLWDQRQSLTVLHPWLIDAWLDAGIITERPGNLAPERIISHPTSTHNDNRPGLQPDGHREG